MPNPMSENFQNFQQSLTANDPAWMDDFDLEALDALEGAERAQAEQILIERLELEDRRVPRALAAMKSASAVAPLTRLLDSAHGGVRVEVVMALWELQKFEGTVDHLLTILRAAEAADRLSAAHYLSDFKEPRVNEALLTAAEKDPDPDVRATAATSLLLIHGVMESPFDISQGNLLIGIASDDAACRAAALSTLGDLLQNPLPRLPPEPNIPSATPSPKPVASATSCAKCGQPLKAGVKFCSGCGVPIQVAPAAAPAEPGCPKCGAPRVPNAKFCRGCGQRLQ